MIIFVKSVQRSWVGIIFRYTRNFFRSNLHHCWRIAWLTRIQRAESSMLIIWIFTLSNVSALKAVLGHRGTLGKLLSII